MAAGHGFRWIFKLVDESDFATPETGKTATVTISKNGASFASLTGSPSATEVGTGWYYIDVPADDIDGEPFVMKATATGCAQADQQFMVSPKLARRMHGIMGGNVCTQTGAAVTVKDEDNSATLLTLTRTESAGTQTLTPS